MTDGDKVSSELLLKARVAWAWEAAEIAVMGLATRWH